MVADNAKIKALGKKFPVEKQVDLGLPLTSRSKNSTTLADSGMHFHKRGLSLGFAPLVN